jgi:hypothetical protein
MKLLSNALKLAAAIGLCLSVAGTADAAMKKMDHMKKMTKAEMHCMEMHGKMKSGKCMMKKK